MNMPPTMDQGEEGRAVASSSCPGVSSSTSTTTPCTGGDSDGAYGRSSTVPYAHLPPDALDPAACEGLEEASSNETLGAALPHLSEALKAAFSSSGGSRHLSLSASGHSLELPRPLNQEIGAIGNYLERDQRLQSLLDTEGGITLAAPCSMTQSKIGIAVRLKAQTLFSRSISSSSSSSSIPIKRRESSSGTTEHGGEGEDLETAYVAFSPDGSPRAIASNGNNEDGQAPNNCNKAWAGDSLLHQSSPPSCTIVTSFSSPSSSNLEEESKSGVVKTRRRKKKGAIALLKRMSSALSLFPDRNDKLEMKDGRRHSTGSTSYQPPASKNHQNRGENMANEHWRLCTQLARLQAERDLAIGREGGAGVEYLAQQIISVEDRLQLIEEQAKCGERKMSARPGVEEGGWQPLADG